MTACSLSEHRVCGLGLFRELPPAPSPPLCPCTSRCSDSLRRDLAVASLPAALEIARGNPVFSSPRRKSLSPGFTLEEICMLSECHR